MMMILAAIFLALLQPTHALVLSRSGQEATFVAKAQFRSLVQWDDLHGLSEEEVLQLGEDRARFHFGHLFGFFQAKDYSKRFGINPDLTEGMGSLRLPLEYGPVELLHVEGDEHVHMSYEVSGRTLLHNKVVTKWFQGARKTKVNLPLLYDLPKVYFRGEETIYPDYEIESFSEEKWERCTDDTYTTPTDFSYFYNPYRPNRLCYKLRKEPLAKDIELKMRLAVDPQWLKDRGQRARAKFSEIRSDNSNGPIYAVYFLHGYDSNPLEQDEPKKDAGFELFNKINDLLTGEHGMTQVDTKGFLEWAGQDAGQMNLRLPITVLPDENLTELKTFVKDTESYRLVVRHLLVHSNTGDEDWLDAFPLFWKEAWENGDYIQFGGHASDGALSAEDFDGFLGDSELDAIEYNPNKRQIVHMDACSSYSYYLNSYAWAKDRRKSLQFMSNGLVSLYHTAFRSTEALLGHILSQGEDPTWAQVMTDVEAAMGRAFIEDEYYPEDWEEEFEAMKEDGEYPTYLLNVGGVW